MRLQAFAKINLGLDVLGKREDGYHEVRMIMQTIRMYDQLDMRKSVEPGIHLTTNKKYIPVEENFVESLLLHSPVAGNLQQIPGQLALMHWICQKNNTYETPKTTL